MADSKTDKEIIDAGGGAAGGSAYRERYIVNDEPVGNYSAVATVTTIP